MVATASPSAMRVPNEKNQKWSCDGYKKSKKVKARAARSLDNVPLSSTNRGASWVAHNVGSPDVRPRRRDSNGFLLRASFASALVVPRAPPITSAAEMDSTAAMWSPEIASSCPWTLAWAEAARSSCPRVAEVANKPDGGSAPLPTSTGVASLRARMTGDWDRLARGGGRGTPSQRLWGAAFMTATSRRTCMVRDGVEMRLLAITFTAYRTPVSSCMPSFTLRSLFVYCANRWLCVASRRQRRAPLLLLVAVTGTVAQVHPQRTTYSQSGQARDNGYRDRGWDGRQIYVHVRRGSCSTLRGLLHTRRAAPFPHPRPNSPAHCPYKHITQ